MPKPLSAGKRNAIIEDIKAARESGKSAGQIARDHGVARSTVTKITREEGLTGAFERAQTENATRAREADCKALRAQLKLDLMHDAQWLRQRVRGRHQTVVSTPQGAEIVTLDEAPLSEVRSGYTALGIAVDKSLALEKHDDSGGDVDHAKSVLGRLFSDLAGAVNGDAAATPEDG